MHADNIETYYYGLRLLPGQDPNCVYVGWFTSTFNKPNFEFSPKCVRHVNLGALDGGAMKTRWVSSCTTHWLPIYSLWSCHQLSTALGGLGGLVHV